MFRSNGGRYAKIQTLPSSSETVDRDEHAPVPAMSADDRTSFP